MKRTLIITPYRTGLRGILDRAHQALCVRDVLERGEIPLTVPLGEFNLRDPIEQRYAIKVERELARGAHVIALYVGRWEIEDLDVDAYETARLDFRRVGQRGTLPPITTVHRLAR